MIKHLDLARGRSFEDAAGCRAPSHAARSCPTPTRTTRDPRRARPDPGGSRRRARRRSRRARCRGAARTGTTRRERRGARARREPRSAADSASEARPSTTTTGPVRSPRVALMRSRAAAAEVFARHRARRPRSRAPRGRARSGARSTIGTPSSNAARRTRRWRTGNSSSRSGPSSTIAAARSQSAISARGRPSTTSAGRPSPICASTLSVPSTPFMSLANAYASSLVPRAPPSSAIDSGPCCATASRSSSAAASSASGHDTWRSSSSTRPEGLEHAPLGVHPLDAVATLVAEPAVVDRLGVDAEEPHEPVRRRLQRARGTAPRTRCTTSRPSRGPTAAP